MYKKDDTNQKAGELSLFEKVLDALLQKFIVIVIAVVIALVAGYIYDKVRGRQYVVYETVAYTARNTAEISSTGEIKENSSAHINAASKYFSTVCSFISTGVVVDRANFYYDQFQEFAQSEKNNVSGDIIQEYIYIINGTNITNSVLADYTGAKFDITVNNGTNSVIKEKCVLKSIEGNKLIFEVDGVETEFSRGDSDGEISSVVFSPFEKVYDSFNYSKNGTSSNAILQENIVASAYSDSYNIDIGYTDKEADIAGIKAKLVVLAANQEMQVYENKNYTQQQGKAINYKYFNIVQMSLIDLGVNRTTVDISQKKILIIFCAAGALLGCAIVYLLSLLDSTLTEKKEIEKITGAPLFTFIEEVKEEAK